MLFLPNAQASISSETEVPKWVYLSTFNIIAQEKHPQEFHNIFVCPQKLSVQQINIVVKFRLLQTTKDRLKCSEISVLYKNESSILVEGMRDSTPDGYQSSAKGRVHF